jgi:hypothetical protein
MNLVIRWPHAHSSDTYPIREPVRVPVQIDVISRMNSGARGKKISQHIEIFVVMKHSEICIKKCSCFHLRMQEILVSSLYHRAILHSIIAAKALKRYASNLPLPPLSRITHIGWCLIEIWNRISSPMPAVPNAVESLTMKLNEKYICFF